MNSSISYVQEASIQNIGIGLWDIGSALLNRSQKSNSYVKDCISV